MLVLDWVNRLEDGLIWSIFKNAPAGIVTEVEPSKFGSIIDAAGKASPIRTSLPGRMVIEISLNPAKLAL